MYDCMLAGLRENRTTYICIMHKLVKQSLRSNPTTKGLPTPWSIRTVRPPLLGWHKMGLDLASIGWTQLFFI